MSLSYFTMWGMLVVMAFGAVVTVVFNDNPIGAIRDAYPSDLAKQEALQRCDQIGAEFSRFSLHDRETCYRVFLPGAAQAPANNVIGW
jgi:hypothetical protein